MKLLWSGTLRKMRVEATAPVTYRLADGFHDPDRRTADLPLNPLLGRAVALRFTGEIACVTCGRAVKKTFGEGWCFPCSQTRAEADLCIVRPELCHFGNAGHPCRDEAFALANCFQPHVLYVSLTSGFKVGITRRVNLPTRWIDQGAVAAIPLAVLPNRREVGLIEASLAQRFADKTHWMRMLQEAMPPGDLVAHADEVLAALAALGAPGILPAAQRTPHVFVYPVTRHPVKVKSLNLDKDPVAAGELLGIKGQYLILDSGVINLRKYAGYRAELRGEPA
ncbi:MAG: DUF2797 domain-containing protein [Candidatus Krumholzibacteriia bacterium]